MKKSIFLFVLGFYGMVYSQSQATLDSISADYKVCIEQTKDRVTCTKELFWLYQDLQFDFYHKSVAGLDSITKVTKAKACGEWVKSKDFFVGAQILKFMRKFPNERIDKPSKIAENDAYLAFKNICDYILDRIKYLLTQTESKK